MLQALQGSLVEENKFIFIYIILIIGNTQRIGNII